MYSSVVEAETHGVHVRTEYLGEDTKGIGVDTIGLDGDVRMS